MNKKKKIAIVCGHFIPNLGYIEVFLAKKTAANGSEVKVFTTNEIPGYVKDIAVLDNENQHFSVVRLPAYFSMGQMVLSRDLIPEIKQFNPDTIIVIGVGKLFPKDVFNAFPGKEIITLFGDNVHNYNVKSGGKILRIKQYVLNKIKNPVYRKAIKKSHKLIGYTPETGELLNLRFPDLADEIQRKYTFVSLGFDDEIYFYDSAIRQKERARLGLQNDEISGITVTRFHPNKQIEKIIDFVELLQKYQPVKYILTGASNDEYSRKIAKIIKQKHLEDTIFVLPFENDKHKINALYNAADFGIWTQPAISIVEAKGTGLPVFLPEEKSMEHLVKNKTGLFYPRLDDTFAQESIHFLNQTDREEVARKNQEFNYNRIVQQIVNENDKI